MLRITQSSGSGIDVVKLEGKLLEPWLGEVRSLCVPKPAGSYPVLDLSGLTFVDGPGTDLLRDLLREGVPIACCSAFVAALLGLNDTRKP